MFYKKININGTEYPLAVNITGEGAPTASTAAEVGMFYMNTSTGDVYKCTAVSGSTYTWELLVSASGDVSTDLLLLKLKYQYGDINTDSNFWGVGNFNAGKFEEGKTPLRCVTKTPIPSTVKRVICADGWEMQLAAYDKTTGVFKGYYREGGIFSTSNTLAISTLTDCDLTVEPFNEYRIGISLRQVDTAYQCTLDDFVNVVLFCEDRIEQLNSKVDTCLDMLVGNINTDPNFWGVGNFESGVFVEGKTPLRCVTKTPIPSTVKRVICADGWEMQLAAYDKTNGKFIGYYKEGGTFSTSSSLTTQIVNEFSPIVEPFSKYNIGILLRKTDTSYQCVLEDYVNVCFNTQDSGAILEQIDQFEAKVEQTLAESQTLIDINTKSSEWVLGNFKNSQITENATPLRCVYKDYIPSTVTKMTTDEGYKMQIAAYDKDSEKFIGYLRETGNFTPQTGTEAQHYVNEFYPKNYPDYSFKMLVRHEDGSEGELSDFIHAHFYSNTIDNTHIIVGGGTSDIVPVDLIEYEGEKVNIRPYTMQRDEWGTIEGDGTAACQDMVVYGDRVLLSFDTGKYSVYDLTTKTKICDGSFASRSSSNHSNTICVGGEDTNYVYVYISESNSPNRCFVERTPKNSLFESFESVQTITYENSFYPARFYWLVDRDANKLYIYGSSIPSASSNPSANYPRITEFDLPDRAEDITLTDDDAICTWGLRDTMGADLIECLQGADIIKHKLYLCDGSTITEHQSILVYDLNTHKYLSRIQTNANKYEPEGVAEYNGSLLCAHNVSNKGYVTQLSFDGQYIYANSTNKEPDINTDDVVSKKITVFGDSIWARDNKNYSVSDIPYNANTYGTLCRSYPTLIREKYGFTVTNKAVSGHKITDQLPIILAETFTDTDIVIISVGVNDHRQSEPLGAIPAATGIEFDTTTYIGGLCKGIEHIKTQNPNAKIILVTPMQRDTKWRNSGVSDLSLAAVDIYTKNNNNNTVEDFRNAVIEVAKNYSCIVADMYAESGLNYLTMATHTSDGLHPVNVGYEFTAPCIFRAIEKTFD